MAKNKKSKRTKTRSSSKIANDNISTGLEAMDLVPPHYRGSDRFLDLVAWNIRYFHDKDKKRVRRIAEILSALNADIIVCEEIMDGSLESVAEQLARLGAGYYNVAYGTTGGDQRVAIMYDVDWVRAKGDIAELFEKGKVIASNGKDAFPRLPLRGHFTCLPRDTNKPPFDFQLLGVHLKSQRSSPSARSDNGEIQRKKSAEKLADWLQTEAPKVDADVIITGDWNEPPEANAWQPLRNLQSQGQLLFSSLNDTGTISHFMYKTKSNFGSRLDLTAVTVAAEKQIKNKPDVVTWTSLTELLAQNPKGKEIRNYIKQVTADISDHMPVVTRFYFTEE